MKFKKALSVLLTLCMLLSVFGVAVYAEDVRPVTTETVTYMDEAGEEKTVEAGIIESGGQPYGAQGETNWYILKGTASVSGQVLFYDAQANIILADDADWTVSANFIAIYGSMYFYAQENGTGKLTLTEEKRVLTQNGGDMKIFGGEITAYAVHADADHNGTLSIHGGKVNSQMLFGYNVNICGGEATGVLMQVKGTFTMSDGKLTAIKGSNGSGLAMEAGSIEISGGTVFAKGTYGMYCKNGSVTITGGTVTADGGGDGISGIYGKNVTIIGGNVTVNEGRYFGIYASETVKLGADIPDTSILLNKPDSADTTFVIKEGQTLTDGENDYTGTLTAEQIAAFAGKTLTCKHVMADEWTFFDETRHAKVCTTCGEALVFEGHDIIVRGDGDATCVDEGYTGDEFCSVCGQRLSEGEIIPPTGIHDYTDAEWTCFSADQHVRNCTVCGEPEYEEHDVIVKGAGDATCVDEGYTGDEYCSVCGQRLSEGSVIPPKGHITEVVGAKEATATEDGYTGDEVCTVCGETVKQGEVIPATDDTTPDEPDDGDACPYCGKHHAKKWGLIVHLVLWFLCNVYRIVRK